MKQCLPWIRWGVMAAALCGVMTSPLFAQKGSPPPAVIPPFITGYVLLAGEPKQKAEGIEVRLMYGNGGGDYTSGIPTGASVMTEAMGRFNFSESDLRPINQPIPLYLFVNIEGYMPIYQPAIKMSNNNTFDVEGRPI